MNYKNFTLIFLTFSLISFILSGCGYKPTSHYAKNEISGKVFVKLKVDIKNATNSVLAKDAVNEMVIGQFGAKLVNDETKANTVVNVSLGSVVYTTLKSDTQGFAQLYRTTVKVNLNYINKQNKLKRSVSVTGSYDYTVDDDSSVTDAKKEESVKIAATKALNDIFSQIAVQSFKKTKSKK